MTNPSWLTDSLIRQMQDMSSIIETPDAKRDATDLSNDVTDLSHEVITAPDLTRRSTTSKRSLRARLLLDNVETSTSVKQSGENQYPSKEKREAEQVSRSLMKDEKEVKPEPRSLPAVTAAQPTSPLDLSFLARTPNQEEGKVCSSQAPGPAEEDRKLPYNPDQMPCALFGLDPVFWSSLPLTTSTLRRLRRSTSEPSTFVLSNHPLRNVELCGFLTEVKRWSNRVRIVLDDSHGAVGCVKWGEGDWNVEVGDLLTVRGALTVFREAIEIRINRSFKQVDLNKMTVHLLLANEQLGLLLTHPFVIPEREKMINDFGVKIKRGILSNILTNGAAECLEKFLDVPAMKMWTRSLLALTGEPQLTSICRIHAQVSTIEQGGTILRRQDEIRGAILAYFKSFSLLSVKDLEDRFKKEDLLLVLDSLISSGIIYECDDL